jgi:hypothetical protein
VATAETCHNSSGLHLEYAVVQKQKVTSSALFIRG